MKSRKYEIGDLDQMHQPLTLKMAYTIDNLCMVTPEEAVFQTSGLLSPISMADYRAEIDERQNPVVILSDQRYDKTVRIRYPIDWTPITAFLPVSDENTFGTVHGTYLVEEGMITIDQSLKLRLAREPKEAYKKLLQLMGEGSLLDIPNIIFSWPAERNL